MSDEALKYDALVESALRGVVRKVLISVAEQGLPGDHHFYITFRTDHLDTEVPKMLRERYPSEMTIVIQHQFWDLIVEDEFFSVLLSFSNVPHKLVVPFEAITAFADPSVRFGLQFDGGLVQQDDSEPEAAPAQDEEAAGQEATEVAADAKSEASEASEDSEKVVTLDRFRKK